MSENILELIQRAAVNAVNAAKPCAIVYGTIKATDPIKIDLGEAVIDEDFLIKTEGAVDNLKHGDRVALLRNQGGQEFLLLDKVVD